MIDMGMIRKVVMRNFLKVGSDEAHQRVLQ